MKRSFACIAALACLCGLQAQAQDYPTKTVRLIVGFPAGGGSDVVARIIAQKLGTELGQSVVVENRPGASANNPRTYRSASSTPAPSPPGIPPLSSPSS